MEYKIFGTVKHVKCDAKSKVLEVEIIPTHDYAVKGTLDPRKKLALMRPKDDIGVGKLFEYSDVVCVTGNAIGALASVLTSERVVGFEFEELKPKTKGNLRFKGVAETAGEGGKYRFIGVVLS